MSTVHGITGNLVWTDRSRVWAVYRVTPTPIAHRTPRRVLELWNSLRLLLGELTGPATMWGVLHPIDPAEIGRAMIDGVDLDVNQSWVPLVEHALDVVEGLDLHQRRHYLAVALPQVGGWRGSLHTASAEVSTRFGVPAAAPSASTRRATAAAAERELERLRRAYPGLAPATAEEVVWLLDRAGRRGLSEPGCPTTGPTGPSRQTGEGDVPASRLARLDDVRLVEGAGHLHPLRARLLRVDSVHGHSYQTMLCLADTPPEDEVSAARALLPMLDRVDVPADWCVLLRPRANAEARRAVSKQLRQLGMQEADLDNQSDPGRHTSAPPGELSRALDQVAEEHERLATNRRMPEIEHTVVVTVWADDEATCRGRAEAVTAHLASASYLCYAPTGGQVSLWSATRPGGPWPAVATDYAQYGLPDLLAAALPFEGRPGLAVIRGALLGFESTTSMPLLHDPAAALAQNRSGATVLVGNSGGGKSQAAKNLFHAAAARGASLVVLDRTVSGEYVRASKVAPVPARVVSLTPGARLSIDPLRMFGTAAERVDHTVGFCCLYAGLPPRGPAVAALQDVVDVVARRPDASFPVLISELTSRGESDPECRELARLVKPLLRGRGLAGLVVGDHPAVDAAEIARSAQMVVVHLGGLSLPRREQMLTEHLARDLLPEHILSQSVLYLAAALTRAVAYADPHQLVLIGLDEVWDIAGSLPGEQLLTELVRDGRKHGAAPIIASQDLKDVPANVRSHIPTRVLVRCDPGPAPAALAYLDADTSPAMVETVGRLETGQCLWRHADGSIDQVDLVASLAPALADAFNTNPAEAGDDPGGNDLDEPDPPAPLRDLPVPDLPLPAPALVVEPSAATAPDHPISPIADSDPAADRWPPRGELPARPLVDLVAARRAP